MSSLSRKLLAGAVALAVPSALACDCGCAVCPAISPAEAGRYVAEIALQTTRYGTVRAGTTKQDNPAGERLTVTRLSTPVAVGFAPGFSFITAPGTVTHAYHRLEADGSTRSASTTHFADLPLLVRYDTALIKAVTPGALAVKLGVFAGMKAPTGDSAALARVAAEEDAYTTAGLETHVGAHDLAAGSGAWDGILGLALRVEADRYLATGQLRYDLRTEGRAGYRFADVLVWETAAGVYVVKPAAGTKPLAIAVLAQLSGDHAGHDRLDGTALEDSGGDIVYAGPALLMEAGDSGRLTLSAEVPAYARMSATQLAPDWRVRASVSVRF